MAPFELRSKKTEPSVERKFAGGSKNSRKAVTQEIEKRDSHSNVPGAAAEHMKRTRRERFSQAEDLLDLRILPVALHKMPGKLPAQEARICPGDVKNRCSIAEQAADSGERSE